MAWTPKATIQFANDIITASLVLDEDSATREAVQGIASALITAALLADPTLAENLTEVATTVVEERIAAENLLRADAPQAPQLGVPEEITFEDLLGQTAARIARDGSFAAYGKSLVGGLQFDPSGDPRVIEFTDLAGATTLKIDELGQWHFYGLDQVSAVRRVRMVIGAGQSLSSGRGRPLLSDVDRSRANLFQVGFKTRTLRAATSPLDMQDTPSGISPLWVYGAGAADAAASDEVIVLIPSGMGGTGLVASGAANGCWDPDFAGSIKLYQRMLAQITDAVALVSARWPGAQIVWESFLWNQGEYDAQQGITQAAWAAKFDQLAAGVRAHIASDVPIILGQSVPEWIASEAGAPAIMAAQIDTPARLERTAFAYAPVNASNYNDLIHPNRAGAEGMGHAMRRAVVEAAVNIVGTDPVPPTTVTAVRDGSTVTIRWDRPLCRVTTYTVQTNTDGAGWVTLTRSLPLHREATLTGVTGARVQVRISTTNTVGTSTTTTPVTAIGA